jgi:hypothetical protein
VPALELDALVRVGVKGFLLSGGRDGIGC